MATILQVIQAYSPRIIKGPIIGIDDVVSYIADRTGMNEGPIRLALMELRDAVAFYNLKGSSVKLDGLGIYSPDIDLSGTVKVSHRPDKGLKNRLNAPGEFRGHIKNHKMIGMSMEELVEIWNEEHPDDPVKWKKKK